MTRDVAFDLPAGVPDAKVTASFTPLLISDALTDTTGTKLSTDLKSLAWTLTYHTPDKAHQNRRS